MDLRTADIHSSEYLLRHRQVPSDGHNHYYTARRQEHLCPQFALTKGAWETKRFARDLNHHFIPQVNCACKNVLHIYPVIIHEGPILISQGDHVIVAQVSWGFLSYGHLVFWRVPL